MKIAMPVCGNRVSTVFDAADELLIIDNTTGASPELSRIHWSDDTLIARTTQIRELGVQVLICGALSDTVERMLNAAGVQVIPFIRGTADEVFEAFRNGRLQEKRFYLPGCIPCEGQEQQRRNLCGFRKEGTKNKP